MVAKPVGIRTVLSNIPFYTGHDGGDPRRYFKLGRFTMGNSHGFQMSHGLEYGEQLLYPMPPVWELLAYDIKDGASCLFQELVDVPDLSLKQPWDRTPTPFNQLVFANPGGGSGVVTMWSYTVPVGRRLLLTSARVHVVRALAPTSVNYEAAWIELNGAKCVWLQAASPTPGVESWAELQGGPVILNATNTLVAKYENADAGGTIYVNIAAAGTLFDS